MASGFFNVVVPPYYKITIGKNDDNRMYMREKRDLPQWCSQKLFYPRFEIKVKYLPSTQLPDKVLNHEEFDILTEILFDYGLLLDNLSAELSIEPELLEALCRCTHYLSPETMDTTVIKEYTNADSVTYDPATNTLTLTILDEDMIIPLIHVRERIYGKILRLLQRLNWTLWQIYITTKKTPNCVEQPVSLYTLYSIFKMCRDSLIKIEPLKGLGSMLPEDLTKTCLDPRNRKVINVKSSGDVDLIINLMEKDSAARKQLSSAPIGSYADGGI